MHITIPEVTEYLSGLYRPLNSKLKEFRRDCEEKHVPIILKDAEELILNTIRMKKPKEILEIGTAVGYSAICFATAAPYVNITTLELREATVEKANRNIKDFGFQDRIQVIQGDGRETLLRLKEELSQGERAPFDMVFIDGAKGHYMEFWEKIQSLIAAEAVVISDNVLYKAITASDRFLTLRRNGTIMRRMREYLTHITSLEHVTTCVLPVGDGLAISRFTEGKNNN